MLADRRRSYQIQGVGKQKLCVLRLIVDQGQLQIVQVRPYEGEIDRLINRHDDHLSRIGCSDGRRRRMSVCDTRHRNGHRISSFRASESAKRNSWFLY